MPCIISNGTHNQERNEVRWRPGQEASLALPRSNLTSFRNQMYGIKESTCGTVGLFGAQGIAPPWLRPCEKFQMTSTETKSSTRKSEPTVTSALISGVKNRLF